MVRRLVGRRLIDPERIAVAVAVDADTGVRMQTRVDPESGSLADDRDLRRDPGRRAFATGVLIRPRRRRSPRSATTAAWAWTGPPRFLRPSRAW